MVFEPTSYEFEFQEERLGVKKNIWILPQKCDDQVLLENEC